MPDPIARKRLKKKMLDRWENEGGAIAPTQQPRTIPDRRAKIRATGRNYLLSAITRRSARPHLRRRGASLLGNESGSKRSVQRLMAFGLRGAPNSCELARMIYPQDAPSETHRDSYLYIFDFCIRLLFPPKTAE